MSHQRGISRNPGRAHGKKQVRKQGKSDRSLHVWMCRLATPFAETESRMGSIDNGMRSWGQGRPTPERATWYLRGILGNLTIKDILEGMTCFLLGDEFSNIIAS